MSQIFYESDNLTITGSGGSWIGSEIIGTIRLIFSIHINGKLKTFFHEFELERSEVYTELTTEGPKNPENTYHLKNWYAWNHIHDMLQSLGYMQDTEVSIINKWTSKISHDCDTLGVNTPIATINE